MQKHIKQKVQTIIFGNIVIHIIFHSFRQVPPEKVGHYNYNYKYKQNKRSQKSKCGTGYPPPKELTLTVPLSHHQTFQQRTRFLWELESCMSPICEKMVIYEGKKL